MPASGHPAPAHISARHARRILLARQGLGREVPQDRSLRRRTATVLDRLGYVQVDSIQTVERAHHMILAARRPYRQQDLSWLTEKDRGAFENWTHDASIIPIGFYPYWQRHFARIAGPLKARWIARKGPDFQHSLDLVVARLAAVGPQRARDFDDPGGGGRQGWWDWHPAKVALEYLWRTGVIAVTRRDGFEKVYDLCERVIPADLRAVVPDEGAFIDWACRNAIARLGLATECEIAGFWGILRLGEVRRWAASSAARDFDRVMVEALDGSPPRRALADPGAVADDLAPPGKLRVISPFDPVIRDRARLARLFGFEYRIEVFVPEAKRTYGYYVFPLLEGERFVGRIDMRRDPATSCLAVRQVWWEPPFRPTRARIERLERELARIARFAGCEAVTILPGAVGFSSG